jgi:uncharacterized protein
MAKEKIRRNQMSFSGIYPTEIPGKVKTTMSAEATGMHSPSANDDNAHANGNEAQSQAEPNSQELTPDQPPQPVEGPGKIQRPRGFAAMDRKLVSEIARKGGKAAHSARTAHEFTAEEARVAGRKGGRATHAKRRILVEG